MQEDRSEKFSRNEAPPLDSDSSQEVETLLQQAEIARRIAQAQQEVAENQRLASESQRRVATKLRQAVADIIETSEKS